jgi:type IV fimbrial biogenesis protein FimT
VLIVILMAFTVPNQTFLIQKTNAQVSSAELLRAIQLARSEAILREETVSLCKSDNQQTCSGAWESGYIITTKNQLLFAFRNNLRGKIHWRAFPAGREDLQFNALGAPNSENGTFWFCPDKNPAWAIMLSKSGRVRISFPDKSGTIKDDKGEVITC